MNFRYLISPACKSRGRWFFYHIGTVFAVISLITYISYHLITSQQLTDKQWNDLYVRGTLRIGIDPGVKPFSYYSETGWAGIDADIAAEVGHRIGLNIQTIAVGYDSLYDSLSLWQVDVLISAIPLEQNRTSDYAYTVPYYDDGSVLVTKVVTDFDIPNDLVGMRVGTILGSEGDRRIRYFERRISGLKRIPSDSLPAALDMLYRNEIDWLTLDALEAEMVRVGDGQLRTQHLTYNPLSMVVRRDNAKLLTRLNAIIEGMRSDGTLQHIIDRWSSH